MSHAAMDRGARKTVPPWLFTAFLVGAFLWSYWPTLHDLWAFWQRNSDYSVGQLVPFAALYLIWSDRKTLRTLPVTVCWWGLGVLLLAQGVRIFGVYYMFRSLEQYSLVITAAGIVLFVLGYPVARRMLWVFAFLFLMVPLPRRIHESLSLPLQDFATTSAVLGLELLGYLVVREGNSLRLSENTQVAVAEACSGLRMLTAFVVVAAALAFVVRRSKWQKAIVVVSSVPVAILANTLRLVVTVVLYESAGSRVAERFFHDFAGVSMMPFAVVTLMGEFWLMRWVTQAAHPTSKSSNRRRPG